MEIGTAHKLLAAYLERHCRGRAAAWPQARVIADLAAMGLRISAREIFDLEAECVLAGLPVGSWGKGLYWCMDEEDFRTAYGYLVSRFEPMRARAEALERQRAEKFPAGGMLFDPAGQEAKA